MLSSASFFYIKHYSLGAGKLSRQWASAVRTGLARCLRMASDEERYLAASIDHADYERRQRVLDHQHQGALRRLRDMGTD